MTASVVPGHYSLGGSSTTSSDCCILPCPVPQISGSPDATAAFPSFLHFCPTQNCSQLLSGLRKMSSEPTWFPSPMCSLRCVPCQENLPDSRAPCQHILPSAAMINLDKCAVEKPESEFPFVNQLQIRSQLQGKWCGELEPPHLRAKVRGALKGGSLSCLLLPSWQVS